MSAFFSLPIIKEMSSIGCRSMHSMRRLYGAKMAGDSLEKGRNAVIDASLQLIRERAKLEGELVRTLGNATATSTLLGVPLGPNSSFLQGPAFAPPRIREAIWTASTNLITEEGKDVEDVRVLTDVGDVPVQEIRDCWDDDDDRLMNVITDSVKAVMDVDPLRPLVLGGDHSITFPVVRAVHENLGGPIDILHFGAHPGLDAFNDKIYGHASTFARIKAKGYARRLVQVGIRSTSGGHDQGKKLVVEQHEMRTISGNRRNLEKLKLGDGVKGVYISINVDCLDPAIAPGVCHRESGGLSLRSVLNIIQNLQGNIVGGDVVGYNPQRDSALDATAEVAAKLVRELAAKISK